MGSGPAALREDGVKWGNGAVVNVAIHCMNRGTRLVQYLT